MNKPQDENEQIEQENQEIETYNQNVTKHNKVVEFYQNLGMVMLFVLSCLLALALCAWVGKQLWLFVLNS